MRKAAWLFALLSVDLFSKILALHYIPPMVFGNYPYGGVAVVANCAGISLSLNTVGNTGAAWGILQGYSGWLFCLRMIVIVGLVVYLLYSKSRGISKGCLWLIAVGAFGNALDYLLYGYVIDFFHFVFWGYSFPVFNWADTYITLGAIGLLLFHKQKNPHHDATHLPS